jgi:hypothetical protein
LGYDSWDRTTPVTEVRLERDAARATGVLIYDKGRIMVPLTITRYGIGTGMGRSPSPEIAHEIALKAAEADATEPALATFGIRSAQVTRTPKKAAARNGYAPLLS